MKQCKIFLCGPELHINGFLRQKLVANDDKIYKHHFNLSHNLVTSYM
jgi:hypothetical protein